MAPIIKQLKSLTCSMSGHDFKVSNVINERVSELCCSRCGKEITNNIYGEVVPLNDHYSRINQSLMRLADSKRRRQRAAVA